jgi:hypothetical protein
MGAVAGESEFERGRKRRAPEKIAKSGTIASPERRWSELRRKGSKTRKEEIVLEQTKAQRFTAALLY